MAGMFQSLVRAYKRSDGIHKTHIGRRVQVFQSLVRAYKRSDTYHQATLNGEEVVSIPRSGLQAFRPIGYRMRSTGSNGVSIPRSGLQAFRLLSGEAMPPQLH